MSADPRVILRRSSPCLVLGALALLEVLGPSASGPAVAIFAASLLVLAALCLRESRLGRTADGLQTALDSLALGLAGAVGVTLAGGLRSGPAAIAFALSAAAVAAPWVASCARGAGATLRVWAASTGLGLLLGGAWLGVPEPSFSPLSAPAPVAASLALLGLALLAWRSAAGDFEAALLVGSPDQQRRCQRVRLGATLVLPAAAAATALALGRPSLELQCSLALLAIVALLRSWPARSASPLPAPPVERAARLAALAEFARLVAHEIRNSLSVLFSTTDLLKRERTAAERDELLAALTEEGDRILSVVDHLTAFAGRDDAQRRLPLRLRDLVRTAADLAIARPAWPAGLEISLERLSDREAVLGDPLLLEIAIAHVLERASRGGARQVLVSSDGSAPAERVQLRVEGDGRVPTGLVEGAPARVLEQAANVDGALGLAVAQRVAREHGGELRFGRTEAGGFRAELSLPALPD